VQQSVFRYCAIADDALLMSWPRYVVMPTEQRLSGSK